MATAEVQTHSQLVARFEEVLAVKDGWLDGLGRAPSEAGIRQVVSHFLHGYPALAPLPSIVPTPEGNLLLEWDVVERPSVDLELSSMKAEFHAFAVDGSDFERDFSLTNGHNWQEFFEFLGINLEPAAE